MQGCDFTTRRHAALDEHVEGTHNCEHCGISFVNLNQHFCTRIGQRGGHVGPTAIDQSFFKETSRSQRGVVINYTYEVDEATELFDDIRVFFEHIHDPLAKLLKQNLQHWRGISVIYRQLTELEDLKTSDTDMRYLGTTQTTLRHENFIEDIIHFILGFVLKQLEYYNSNGSGYRVASIQNAIVSIGQYKPIRPRGYIPTPESLKRRRGLLNIRGQDGLCFQYCVTANFFMDEVEKVSTNKRRLDKQITTGRVHNQAVKRAQELGINYEQYFDTFDWSDLTFPIALDDIDIFEENNKISVNVLTNDGVNSIIIRQTILSSDKHVDLLLIEDNDDSHFVLIHDRSAFEGQSGKNRHHYCTFCQKRFKSKLVVTQHKKTCYNLNQGIMTFPKDKFYTFKNYEMTLKFPFCLYYDWEVFIKPLDTEPRSSTSYSFTKKSSILEPSGYSYALVGPNNFLKAGVYDGPDPVDSFIKTALDLAVFVEDYLKKNSMGMNPTPEERLIHRQATECLMCRRPFTKKRYKVMHHCHVTGKVIGALDNVCNLRIKLKKLLPTVCHNATNFDHAIVLRGFKKGTVKSVLVIPKNSEKFLGFIVNHRLKFLDSCQFLLHSLAKLTEDLKKSGLHKFKYTKEYFQNEYQKDEETIDRLLLSKQVYPYDYMTGPDVYNDTQLPSQDQFYDGLNDKHLSDSDYKHAQNVWNEFNCKILRDYTRLYSISDSLLLADIFESFRDTAFENQGLDPLYVWSAPGFTWQCAMKASKFPLEYIKDFEMLEMIDQGIRGGPTFVTQRICTANNEDLGKECPFDPTKPRKRLLFSDLNSLYANCMLNRLPIGDFKMLTTEEIKKLEIMKLDPDDEVSYIFEVDLEYPITLHDSHDDLPLAVEKRRVDFEEISPTQRKLIKLYKDVVRKPLGCEKLLMTLNPKPNYICYLKTLQFYVGKGLIITNVHRAFRFKQDFIFRDYIKSNIDKRKATTSELVSELLKLLNNSLYGKTLQDSKNFVDVVFSLSRAETVKLLAKPNLKSFMPLNDEITVCQMSRTSITCNSFTYLGFVVLELAKLKLYEGYYDGIKSVFGARSRCIAGDTDSLLCIIDDPDNTYLSDMKRLSHWYDYSNLNVDHPLYSIENKGISGLWKIVVEGIVEVAAISSKMYSLLRVEDIREAKEHAEKIAKKLHPANETRAKKKELMRKGKGIGRGVLEKLKHQHYVNTILEYNKIFMFRMNSIRMDRTQLYRVLIRKIGFHALDTKRFILKGGIDTLAFGNYKIPSIIQESLEYPSDDDEHVTIEELSFDDKKVPSTTHQNSDNTTDDDEHMANE